MSYSINCVLRQPDDALGPTPKSQEVENILFRWMNTPFNMLHLGVTDLSLTWNYSGFIFPIDLSLSGYLKDKPVVYSSSVQ